ncbi:MAG: FISUMP domain-containing protein [Bacteroidota bacterium]
MTKHALLGVIVTIAATTCFAQQYGSLKDARDGRIYKTVKIGEQVWMAENLNADRFRNGDTIFEAKSEEEWRLAGKLAKPAWCYFENEVKNKVIFGKLYNRYALTDPRGLAPLGFEFACDHDWMRIIYKNKSQLNSILGVALGGFRDDGYADGKHEFIGLNEEIKWWSSTGMVSWDLKSFNVDFANGDWDYDNSGFYVRCVKYVIKH